MTDEQLHNLERSARADFAEGHGHWIGPDQTPAMSVAKKDVLWLLDQVALLNRLRSQLATAA